MFLFFQYQKLKQTKYIPKTDAATRNVILWSDDFSTISAESPNSRCCFNRRHDDNPRRSRGDSTFSVIHYLLFFLARAAFSFWISWRSSRIPHLVLKNSSFDIWAKFDSIHSSSSSYLEYLTKKRNATLRAATRSCFKVDIKFTYCDTLSLCLFLSGSPRPYQYQTYTTKW